VGGRSLAERESIVSSVNAWISPRIPVRAAGSSVRRIQGSGTLRDMHWALALLLLVDLGAPFADATADAEQAGEFLRVDLEVELTIDVATVVAHILDPGGGQETVALNSRGGGRYGAIATTARADLVVVFEALRAGEGVLSQPTTFTALGVDPALLESGRGFAPPTTAAPEIVGPTARRWGWAAVALGSGALALLAFWAMGSRDELDQSEDDASEAVAEE
jgi:hypothetical protein